MIETINARKGLSFNIGDLCGYVTGVIYGAEQVEVFARAAQPGGPENAPYRMAHIRCGRKIADLEYGASYPVESWSWITRDDFDRIVDMREIRESMGWRE